MAQIARTGAAKAPTAVGHARDRFAAARDETAEQTVGAVREAAARVEGATESRQTFISLANEQTKHNVETMKALAGTLDWGRVLQIQAEYVRVSLERSAQLTQRFMEVGRAMMVSAASSAQRQARKAA